LEKLFSELLSSKLLSSELLSSELLSSISYSFGILWDAPIPDPVTNEDAKVFYVME